MQSPCRLHTLHLYSHDGPNRPASHASHASPVRVCAQAQVPLRPGTQLPLLAAQRSQGVHASPKRPSAHSLHSAPAHPSSHVHAPAPPSAQWACGPVDVAAQLAQLLRQEQLLRRMASVKGLQP